MDSTQISFFVLESATVYKRNRPSRDQLVGTFASPDRNRTVSSSVPLARFSYRFWLLTAPPSRLETKTMRLPSGDQTGWSLRPSAEVNRLFVPRARSSSHRFETVLPWKAPFRETTARVPSGETARLS